LLKNYKNNNTETNKEDKHNILKKEVLQLTEEHEKFIIENSENKIKDIQINLKKKFNVEIHEKQVVNMMHKYRKKTISFYKVTPEI
jgi:transposase